MRGRIPKPTYLKVLEGNPGKRSLRKREPKPEPSPAQLPAHLRWLDPEAKACWNRLAPELVRVGCLTALDRETLAVYCAAWSRWVAARKVLNREGESFVSANGNLRSRPEVAIANAAEETVRRVGDQLGLTPSGRSRIKLPPPEPDGDF